MQCIVGEPATRVSTWRDGFPYALMGALSGTNTLNWQIVVAFPSTDYGGFIWPSIFVTVGFTALLIALLVALLVKANSLKKPADFPRDFVSAFANKPPEESGNKVTQSIEFLQQGASQIVDVLDDVLDKSAFMLTSSEAFEDNASTESDFANDPLAIVMTPLQKKQHRQVEKFLLVVRVAVMMWISLWIWW